MRVAQLVVRTGVGIYGGAAARQLAGGDVSLACGRLRERKANLDIEAALGKRVIARIGRAGCRVPP